MKRRLPLLYLAAALARPALAESCAPVDHDPIAARDLAARVPVFARLDPATPIAPAPGAGVRRVFRALELISLAKGYALDLPAAEDLCFEWPMETLDRGRLREAMQAALPFPDTKIEILETSLYPVPRGTLEFRRNDLGAPALPDSPTPVVWKGAVRYGANQHFAIWARVQITAHIPRVVAAEPIVRGKPISASQVRLVPGNGFPEPGDTATSVDQVAGRLALRPVAAGAEIHLGQLERPPDVKRGDSVAVEVLSGSARLAFTGKSESDGRTGDTITVLNPRSNRVFPARVEGKDKALVEIRSLDDPGASRRN